MAIPSPLGTLPTFVHLDRVERGEAPTPLIAPFIRQGDTAWIVGEKAQGKSTLACDLILGATLPTGSRPEGVLPLLDGRWAQIWGGAARIDRQTMFHGKVVVLDAENDYREWLGLIEDTAASYGLDYDDGHLEWALRSIKWTGHEEYALRNFRHPRYLDHLDAVVSHLKSIHTQLLIIDPIVNVYGEDIERAEWVTMGFQPLRDRLRRAGITTIVLAHCPRPNPNRPPRLRYMPYGASAQENLADVIFGIKRDPEADSITLTLAKRRTAKWNHEGATAKLRGTETFGGYSSANYEWTYRNPRDTGELALTTKQQSILAACPPLNGDSPGFTAHDVDYARSAVVTAFNGIFRTHRLVERCGGEGRSGSPYRFRLTDIGMNLRSAIVDDLPPTPKAS